MGAFAGLALLLAGLGIYAVVSFTVERRTQEIGIRVALGATAPRLMRMVVGEALTVAGIGVVVGLGLAVLAALGLRGILFGVSPIDGASLAAAAASLVVAAGVAAFVPARRAASANPSDVLRNQ
jgi:ABC-type antimicrobial peptide transport system permease subunit